MIPEARWSLASQCCWCLYYCLCGAYQAWAAATFFSLVKILCILIYKAEFRSVTIFLSNWNSTCYETYHRTKTLWCTCVLCLMRGEWTWMRHRWDTRRHAMGHDISHCFFVNPDIWQIRVVGLGNRREICLTGPGASCVHQWLSYIISTKPFNIYLQVSAV